MDELGLLRPSYRFRLVSLLDGLRLINMLRRLRLVNLLDWFCLDMHIYRLGLGFLNHCMLMNWLVIMIIMTMINLHVVLVIEITYKTFFVGMIMFNLVL